jgi:hypothetical protein
MQYRYLEYRFRIALYDSLTLARREQEWTMVSCRRYRTTGAALMACLRSISGQFSALVGIEYLGVTEKECV